MRGRTLKTILTLKIKNTQLSDCRIVGLSLMNYVYYRFNIFCNCTFRLRHGPNYADCLST